MVGWADLCILSKFSCGRCGPTALLIRLLPTVHPTLQVWVMTSTSGAAPMTRQQRYAPWQALAERLAQEPWPRQCQLRCCGDPADG